jgi:hypothetical protein
MTDEIMARIAALLPAEQRGAYKRLFEKGEFEGAAPQESPLHQGL